MLNEKVIAALECFRYKDQKTFLVYIHEKLRTVAATSDFVKRIERQSQKSIACKVIIRRGEKKVEMVLNESIDELRCLASDQCDQCLFFFLDRFFLPFFDFAAELVLPPFVVR